MIYLNLMANDNEFILNEGQNIINNNGEINDNKNNNTNNNNKIYNVTHKKKSKKKYKST